MSNLLDEFDDYDEDDDLVDTFLSDLDPDAEALLYSTELQSRVFILNDSSPAVMGMMMEEADDSFLVGLPARLASNSDGSQEAVPYLQVRYFRIQKSSVKFVTHLFHPYADHYIKYLNTNGRKIFPQIMDLLVSGLDKVGDSVESEPTKVTDVADEFSKVVSNMTKEDEERVAETLKCGGLIIPEKKTMQ